jgi:glycerol kinase
MQLQADLLGVPVVRSSVAETTALGAAYAAGLAQGIWTSLDAVEEHWTADRTFAPALAAGIRDERYGGWRRAVERARGWAQGGGP